jgi:hypothetical protein
MDYFESWVFDLEPGDPAEAAIGLGTGMIPGDLIHGVSYRPGIPDAIETISVRHVSGGVSLLTLKSYDLFGQFIQIPESE